MKFLMEKNKNTDHRVTIQIPEKIINNNIIKKFIEISKKENINGFRKGKIPIQIIQKKYGKKVYYDIFNKLMQKFFYEFIEKEKLKIIGSPKYYIHKNEDNKTKDLKYSVIYELHPCFSIQDLSLITAKKIIVNVTDEDIQKYIDQNDKYTEDWKSVNKPIKIHDKVTINYTVYIKNQIVSEFNQKNLSFIMTKDIFISSLYCKIINRYINDVFFFRTTFSQFHPEKKLQNQDVTFKIKIVNIQIKETKKILQSFIIKKDQNNEKKLNFQQIKKTIQKNIQDLSYKYLYNQIVQQLIKKNPIVIPPLLLQEEIKNVYHTNTQEYQNQKGNIFEQKYHLNLTEQAKKNLHIYLIMQKIVYDQKLSPNKNKIEKLIKKISLNYDKPSEIIHLYKTNQFLIEKIQNLELETQVMHMLLKKIRIIEENYTFDQAMNFNWNEN